MSQGNFPLGYLIFLLGVLAAVWVLGWKRPRIAALASLSLVGELFVVRLRQWAADDFPAWKADHPHWPLQIVDPLLGLAASAVAVLPLAVLVWVIWLAHGQEK